MQICEIKKKICQKYFWIYVDTNRLADRYRYRNKIDIGREIYVYRSIDTDTGAYTGI